MIHYPALRLYCYYGFLLAPFTVPGEVYDFGAVKVFEHFGKSAVRASVPVFLLHSVTIFICLECMFVTNSLYTIPCLISTEIFRGVANYVDLNGKALSVFFYNCEGLV